MEDYQVHTLANGIRIAHKQVPHTKIAHCGFTLDIGSRDEHPDQQGLAHFWEHMAFKGTTKRKAFHIINRLEVAGGELNAYTTKEKICFYASILENQFEKALELLTDITFYSTFPEKEIEKEKHVILEEMSMYLDSPEDAIQDDFEQQLFTEHSLGYNILGTQETVKSFQREDFQRFLKENMDSGKIIFNSIGNIPFEKVLKLAEKYLAPLPIFSSETLRTSFDNYLPLTRQIAKPILQAHCMLGRPAYPITDSKRLPFFMLVNLLGGPGMNSRLNLGIREKYGFVYTIEANYTSFINTGIFSIYFATEKKQLEKTLSLTFRELKKLREKPLGSIQLHTIKQQLMGQLAMAEESNLNFMLMMGKSLLDLGQIDSLNDIFSMIENITASQLVDIACEMFKEEDLSLLTYIPS